MEASLKEIIWQQFGAAIDMLENALIACPGELWDSPSKFWYNGYHSLFWLDYYLSDDPKKFCRHPHLHCLNLILKGLCQIVYTARRNCGPTLHLAGKNAMI